MVPSPRQPSCATAVQHHQAHDRPDGVGGAAFLIYRDEQRHPDPQRVEQFAHGRGHRRGDHQYEVAELPQEIASNPSGGSSRSALGPRRVSRSAASPVVSPCDEVAKNFSTCAMCLACRGASRANRLVTRLGAIVWDCRRETSSASS
jgi:hypothetical protein